MPGDIPDGVPIETRIGRRGLREPLRGGLNGLLNSVAGGSFPRPGDEAAGVTPGVIRGGMSCPNRLAVGHETPPDGISGRAVRALLNY
jgi:hypothetical protein